MARLSALCIALVVAACTATSDGTRTKIRTDTSQQAAWYDQYETTNPGAAPETPRSYSIPRHTTCAELAIGDAKVKLLTGQPPRDPERGCADLLIEIEFGNGERATADFRTAGVSVGQCAEFAWTSTVPIDALVVVGHLSDESLTTNVQKFTSPRTSGGGAAVPEPVDGSGFIDGIELCYTTSDETPPPDAGASGGNDGGTSSEGGGKTW